jgi:hypothetical protein
LAHLDAAPREVDQRVDDELPRAVIGDVAAAVGLDEGNAVADRRVLRALPQRVDRRMLEKPELVRGSAFLREVNSFIAASVGRYATRPRRLMRWNRRAS